MFTGLVEETGTVRRIDRKGGYQRLLLSAKTILEELKPGDSVSIDGVCQTVVEIDEDGFSVDTLEVSLQKTALAALKEGSEVNLERALTPASRMGGHMVQGHVDGTGRISAIRRRAENVYLEVLLPKELMPYCAQQGSIAIDGVSLTIAELRGVRIVINIIPTSWKHTTLKNKSVGNTVNIEVDMIARYVARILETRGGRDG